jgi:peptidoglycan/LPS O-acetylase OafA/YrhL
MTGALRLFLAVLVILCHFAGSAYYKHFGYYAVRVFFILSGLAITAALNEVYAFDLRRFWANRGLRLLPLYYIVLTATLAAVLALPEKAAQFATYWAKPSPHDLWLNLALLPMMEWTAPFRIIMPAWSIAVEIVMYAFLSLGIARRRSYAYLLLAAAVAYHAATFMGEAGWHDRYFEPISATLSFSLGTLIYFWRKDGLLRVPSRAILPLFGIWLANMVAGGLVLPPEYIFAEGFYANIVIGVPLVAALADWRPGAALRSVDQYLGKLAYPVFLCHWLAGFAVALAFFEPNARGMPFALTTTAASLLVAVLMAALHEALVEPLRRKIRQVAEIEVRFPRRVQGLAMPRGIGAIPDPTT